MARVSGQAGAHAPRRAVRVVPLLAALGLLAALTPAPATAAPTGEELQETRDSLEQAQREQERTAAAVQQAAEALAESDELLAVRTAELTRLESRAQQAREAEQEARRRTAQVTARLQAVVEELARLERLVEQHLDRLQDRAAASYKHGAGAQANAVLTTAMGMTDLHDLSMVMRGVEETLSDDQALIVETRELVALTAERRAEIAELRDARREEQEAAEAAHAEARALAEQQAALTREVEQERARRAELLAAVEADRERTAALVSELNSAVERLSARLQQEIAVRWQDVQIDGPMPDWAGRLPAHGQRWAPAIASAASQAGVDPRLFAALVWSESNFHPGAVSRVGAIGLSQLMPSTAAGLGVDPYDPVQNLAGGARYLGTQMRAFGRADLALAAYNAGPGAVRAHGGIPPYAETQFYVLTVLQRFEQLAS